MPRNKLSHHLIALVLGVTVASIAGCGSSGASGQRPAIVQIDVSWVRLFQNLGDLKSNSDVAVEGSIVGISDHTSNLTPPLVGTPFTDFQFQVSVVIYGPKSRLGTGVTILLHQTGASSGGQIVEVSDDPLFTIGEKAVLFLHEYSPGRYFVVGGPSGRFNVSATGLVLPINDEGITMRPTPESDFIASVKAAWAKSRHKLDVARIRARPQRSINCCRRGQPSVASFVVR